MMRTILLWVLPVPALWLLVRSVRLGYHVWYSKHNEDDFDTNMASSGLSQLGCITAVSMLGVALLVAASAPPT
jgi:hypothetical protein